MFDTVTIVVDVRPVTTSAKPGAVEAARSRAEVIVGFVRQAQPTLRQLLARLAGARGHFTFEGTPEQVAQLMQEWVTEGVADGFNLMPDMFPSGAEIFVDEVVPILRKRGIFRHEYTGTTLRHHLDLPHPANQYAPATRAEALAS